EIHRQMEEELRLNREAGYAEAAVTGQHMKLGFLKHSLMISRMHFMLELAARNSGGRIHLAAWRQGAELRGHKAPMPDVQCRRIDSSNDYVWEEIDRTKSFPVEPLTASFGFGNYWKWRESGRR